MTVLNTTDRFRKSIILTAVKATEYGTRTVPKHVRDFLFVSVVYISNSCKVAFID